MAATTLALAALAAVAGLPGGLARPPGAPAAAPAAWRFVGPKTYVQRGDPAEMASASAVQQVVRAAGGPGGEPRWLLASVNGGVWRSQEALGAEGAKWANALDGQPVNCASMSALATDPGAPFMVWAGCGPSSSSEMGDGVAVVNSGHWGGLMTSADGGDTWSMGAGFPENYYVSDLLVDPAGSHGHPRLVVVSARSHLEDADAGGVWVCDSAVDHCVQTFDRPVFKLERLATGAIAAALPLDAETSVILSEDGGRSWADFSDGITWPRDPHGWGMLPFYPTLASAGSALILGALTVDQSDPTMTGSGLFWRDTAGAAEAAEWAPIPQPSTSLDDDNMPKDRMALLVDPDDSGLLYVAGNGGQVVWRGRWREDDPAWEDMLQDVAEGTGLPHVDCRNFAWDAGTGSLVLVSDGGVFVPNSPKEKGGSWVSGNGDLAAMELVSVRVGGRAESRRAGGLTRVNSNRPTSPPLPATWLAGRRTTACRSAAWTTRASPPGRWAWFSGTAWERPSTACPSGNPVSSGAASSWGRASRTTTGTRAPRIWAASGSSRATRRTRTRRTWPSGSSASSRAPRRFRTFYQVFRLNGGGEPTAKQRLAMWVQGNGTRPSGFWEFVLDDRVASEADVPAPRLLGETDGGVYDFAFGSMYDGELLVGLNSPPLLVRDGAAALAPKPLPTAFADPVVLTYKDGEQVL